MGAGKMMVTLAAAAVLLASACVREPRDPLRLVIAVDASASIERPAEEQAFDAIETSMRSLGRGDSVVVVPITGDAWDDSQREIVRAHLSQRREPYDADLRRFAKGIRASLETMRAGAVKKPAQSTDILGAIDIAAEEVSRAATGTDLAHGALITPAVLVISDFIQDDREFNFETDPRLANPKRARTLAATLAEQHGARSKGVRIYLGYLASRDGRRLSNVRHEAIETFWTAYLRRQGAQVEWAIDGPGRLPQFLADLRQNAAPTTPTLARLFADLRPHHLNAGSH